MPTVPISKFEHRVARWAKHLKKTRQPLEIKLLVDAGERDVAAGRVYTHEQVGRMLRSNSLPRASRRRKRRS